MAATARDRYEKDPSFRALTDAMLNLFETQLGDGAGITPSEIREASGLAWQLYHARHVTPLFYTARRDEPTRERNDER